MIKCLKTIIKLLEDIKGILVGKDELTDLERIYKEYRTFSDARGMKMLSEVGLVDEYNTFMTECENILFSGIVGYSTSGIELPKPSEKLEAFKNKFNKFFK